VPRQVPIDNKDDSPMLCTFSGSEVLIAINSFTVLEYRTLMEVEFKTKRGPFFNESHTVSGEAVKIFKKKDRGTILTITEGSKNLQILQIKLKEFGSDEVQAFKPALLLATEIAQLYVKNSITKDDLGYHRDKAIAENFGITSSSEAAKAQAPKTKAGKAKAPEATAPKAKVAAAKGMAKGKAPGKKTAAAKATAVAGKPAMPPSSSSAAKPSSQEAAPSTPPPRKKQKLPNFEMPAMMVDELLGAIVIDA
jgi:hypothetical protein